MNQNGNLLALCPKNFIDGKNAYDSMDLKPKGIKDCIFQEDDQYIWLLFQSGYIQKVRKSLLFGKVRIEMEKE